MSFLVRLRPDQIAIDPGWGTFDATVDGLLGRLVRTGDLAAGARVPAAAAIGAREAEASTAVLEIGVGVPHARIEGLQAPLTAFALAASGLYEAVPTVPIRIVALVLSPHVAYEEHLRTLADIATLLHSSELRALLLRVTDGAAAISALRQYSRSLP
jgi:mannitol/fructose-specific phosphotransferase system IIA component (Ntr-type)